MSAKKVIRFIYLKIGQTNEQRFSNVGEEELWGLYQTNKINITKQDLTRHFLYKNKKASVMLHNKKGRTTQKQVKVQPIY